VNYRPVTPAPAVSLQPLHLHLLSPARQDFAGHAGVGKGLVVSRTSEQAFYRKRKGRASAPPLVSEVIKGALYPKARWLQGLKARSSVRPKAAGLKPRPSERHLKSRSSSLFGPGVHV